MIFIISHDHKDVERKRDRVREVSPVLSNVQKADMGRTDDSLKLPKGPV